MVWVWILGRNTPRSVCLDRYGLHNQAVMLGSSLSLAWQQYGTHFQTLTDLIGSGPI